MMREMAAELNVPLYRRFSEDAAAAVVGVTTEEMRQLRRSGAIGYLRLTGEQAGYFGFQLLEFMIDAIQEPQIAETATGAGRKERLPSLPSSAIAPPMLMSVRDAATTLGIGRSKLYELIADGQLEVVHLGRRTLVTVASVRRLGTTATAD